MFLPRILFSSYVLLESKCSNISKNTLRSDTGWLPGIYGSIEGGRRDGGVILMMKKGMGSRHELPHRVAPTVATPLGPTPSACEAITMQLHSQDENFSASREQLH